MDKAVDVSLIARSLAYHGPQMKKIWESERGENDLRRLGVDNVDFSQSQKTTSYLERGKKLKLQQFICSHANVLFDEVLNLSSSTSQSSTPVTAHHHAILPPFDMFTTLDKKDRIKAFFSSLKAGDIIFGPLMTKISNGYLMKVFCSEGETTRITSDLAVKAVIHSGNMVACVDKKNITRSFTINDIVCCEVLEVSANSEKVFAGMKGELCPATLRPRLGLCQQEDLPLFYRKWQEGMKPYEEMLQSSVGFHNPGSARCLSQELAIGTDHFSNFPALRFGFPVEERASELRQSQSSKWAHKSVSEGIALFKANKHSEAFQCLNKALTIDPANVEALVARGALSANGGSFKKAIDDFESAMKINSSHQNARKYLSETLVAYGRSFEEEEKWEEAVASYERCLSVNPQHKEAKNSIEYVKAKMGLGSAGGNSSGVLGTGNSEPETIPLLTPAAKAHSSVKDNFMKHLLASQDKKKKKKKEKKAKRKKNRSSSSSSVSSSSSSSSSSWSSSSSSSGTSQDSHHRHRKQKRKNDHKDKSLSPISKRMALMDSALAMDSNFDADGHNKASHCNPPSSLPFAYSGGNSRSEAMSLLEPLAVAAAAAAAAKQQENDDYESRVKKFLEQTKSEDDYEEKVKKFIEETARRKKDRKNQEEKKKKKKKDKKGRKKKREERKKLKKAAKEEKLRREGKRRLSGGLDDDDFPAKFDLSRLVNLESLPDLEDLQNKLSAYYAKVEKGPCKKKDSLAKLVSKSMRGYEVKSSEEKEMFSGRSKPDDSYGHTSPSPPYKHRKESLEKMKEEKVYGSSLESRLAAGQRSKVDMFESSPSPAAVKRSTSPAHPLETLHSKFKMHVTSSKMKKKEKFDDNHPETWEDSEEKNIDIKDVEPPPPPPTKDEMAQNLKKIVEKKKEAGSAVVPEASKTVGVAVMDKLGGFRINPNVAMQEKKRPSRSRRGSESDSSASRGSAHSSRSGSARPKRKYSRSDSSDRDSYKGRSRSRSVSYTRPRRYRSSDSGSYRSRSYSRSRSRSRSGDYRRSRSRSDDRYNRNRYGGHNRGMRNRGTYYKPRFQAGFKQRGFNRGGYNNRRGFRDFRNRGGYNNRGRGGRGRGGPRYFDYRNRQHRDYGGGGGGGRRYERAASRSDEDSPMRKVDAAKERIDKMISERTGPLSDGEERDDFSAPSSRQDE